VTRSLEPIHLPMHTPKGAGYQRCREPSCRFLQSRLSCLAAYKPAAAKLLSAAGLNELTKIVILGVPSVEARAECMADVSLARVEERFCIEEKE
jgi:hypothetical protein